MLSGLGATINVAKPKPGSSVAVFGLGAVGLAVCLPFASLCFAVILENKAKGFYNNCCSYLLNFRLLKEQGFLVLRELLGLI